MKKHIKNSSCQREAKLLRFREKRNFLVSPASRRAQIRMTETIAILFIFFILLIFGLVFYFQFQKSSIERQKAEILSEKSIDISLRASFLPELVCRGTPTRKDCIDLGKLEVAQDKFSNEYLDYYFDMFGFARITVEEIYPGGENWTLYDRALVDYTRFVSTPVPVSLYDPGEDKYSFGVLTIEVYS